jgi:hypothetical protein
VTHHQQHQSRIGAADAASEISRGMRRRTGAAKLVIGVLAAVLALCATFAAPAGAAPWPRHGATISCSTAFGSHWLDIDAYIFGHTYTYNPTYEGVAWWPQLQRAKPGAAAWQDVTVPGVTSALYQDTATSMNSQIWKLNSGWPIPAEPGYYYRVKSWFWWASHGPAWTLLEYTDPCYMYY